MLWEKKLENWVSGVKTSSNLPIRLALWNGQHYDFGAFDNPSVTLTRGAMAGAALGTLLAPGVGTAAGAGVGDAIGEKLRGLFGGK